MGTRVVILGAGDQGLVVADTLLAMSGSGHVEAVGFIDENPALAGTRILGIPVAGTSARLAQVGHDAVIVAIGDNHRREALSLALERQGERLFVARHPHASVGADVELGPGSIISAGAVIMPGARIGRGVLLNTSCSVDHGTIVGDFAHVGPGATVGARVYIGARTLIGLGARVASSRRVGADAIIGEGSVVVRDVPDAVVAFGVPARVQRHL